MPNHYNCDNCKKDMYWNEKVYNVNGNEICEECFELHVNRLKEKLKELDRDFYEIVTTNETLEEYEEFCSFNRPYIVNF